MSPVGKEMQPIQCVENLDLLSILQVMLFLA